MSKILVTGGAGYIGSHTCLELLNDNYDIVVLDNLSNSSEESLRRVQDITGKSLTFVQGDIRDRTLLTQLFSEHDFEAVIHFAGLKAVGESCVIPLDYYDNNVYGTVVLCEAMKAAGVKRIVFSSSATVYGDPASLPIMEDFPLSATNPYGRSKLMVEDILRDLYLSDNDWSIALLRYFNPVGAHPSGMIGEDPNDIPNNLMPYVTQVAIGKLEKLRVFGNDYPTHDGTGVRDYIHVVDLSLGHVRAIEKLRTTKGANAWNLGVGKGYSVLDMVAAFEKASGKDVPYIIAERRSGDIAACYANPDKARNELGWQAEKVLEDMVSDAWRWQSQNPDGYPS
ncbi:UDP-galactose-4-epimerase [Endozoicomonas montiporae]|uniref:UDP-glucose 4-epimerase n=2 Tax=Endozoicomonas montiporae TaxID=1027273 RepID=A0A081N8V7_9GAMM|nr:UDP-glucose 4-epimerase GalE [Endozoicomonas montiporae]AMO55201.1 UDP-glucose 4-epimerase [Endozoicomonas montiporae CL-33]KEQ14880.1 UDP-galactose-4-epimerase [Endozoicomonas montiporae]